VTLFINTFLGFLVLSIHFPEIFYNLSDEPFVLKDYRTSSYVWDCGFENSRNLLMRSVNEDIPFGLKQLLIHYCINDGKESINNFTNTSSSPTSISRIYFKNSTT
jgi:hypothetical protein